MRNVISLNDNWRFTKRNGEPVRELPKDWQRVCLPHTWNGIDGQDGGNDYYRGCCWYKKSLKKPESEVTYLEFEGANSSAEVFVNGVSVAKHDGGYSTWRVNLTNVLKEENEILGAVDNAPNDRVYPQVADFTFYDGLYRNVNLITVPAAHFELDYYGTPGVKVAPLSRVLPPRWKWKSTWQASRAAKS